ncbi:MAG TPA: glycosyltransferase family 4 protein [Fimbriimonadaceae bacterium]|nr:glycosyltransferase family 4 protein [Fimbriimonadaceae bacterium]
MPAIHLLNPLWDPSGGSEWRTISLFRLLEPHAEVDAWTEYTPHAAMLAEIPVREMLKLQRFPRGGTFVFIGAYWEIGGWLRMAKPERVILVYNVVDPETLDFRIRQIEAATGKPVELVFASEMMARHAGGRRGVVELSPIDLGAFSPGSQEAAATSESSGIVVGRHSRDQAFKHHPDDPELYRRLVETGCRVKLLGGTCLTEEVNRRMGESANGIELLAANSVPVPEFLRSLDVFFYRTDPAWTEPYGRVVAEAMAAGLPCVLENRGGYTSLIRDGENGFLFTCENEAFDRLQSLKEDRQLRTRIGAAARASIRASYDEENRKVVEFYMR